MKFLGVKIDERVNFRWHISIALEKASDVMCRLHPMLKVGSELTSSVKIKVFIYKIFVGSVLIYGITRNTVWRLPATRCKLHKTSFFDLRPHPITFLQVNTRDVHEMDETEKVHNFVQRLTLLLSERTGDHQNPMIASLKDS